MKKHFINATQFNPNSIFESMRSYQGKIFRLEGHLQRLKDSAKMFGMEISKEELLNFKNVIQVEHKKSNIKNAYIRMALLVPSGKMRLIIKEIKTCPAVVYKEGVSLVTSVSRKFSPNSLGVNIKTSNFLSGILAKIDLASYGNKFEILMFGVDGQMSEGTASNVFIVKDKNIFTPPLSSGLLNGITRGVIFDLARLLKVGIEERILTRHDLYNADECFLTNTTIEILPVSEIDKRRIGNSRPGDMTKRLMRKFRELVIEKK